MNQYNHKNIERKWQRIWGAENVYRAKDGGKKKFYALIEFPYPSGDGLHVGHPRPYIGMDIVARKRRMEGYNVLYPIGWDAFGLPTENYAIKTGIHPAVVTKRNTKNFKRQIQSLGISFDWSREINTTDPKYYRWTQWLFLQLLKHGLAYKKKMPINWCLSCKIGLANEEVIDGQCERCGGETEKRDKEQWMLAITKYADRLDKDLDRVDYAERIKIQQRNWIGRSYGTEISFEVRNSSPTNADLTQTHAEEDTEIPGKDRRQSASGLRNSATLTAVKVFTTRADTLFGATYLVLAPEHPFVSFLLSFPRKRESRETELDSHLHGNDINVENIDEIAQYVKSARDKTEIERTAESKEKTGVGLKGIKAVNPANGEEISVWVADYVLADYGTGAIMAVPAHDERDFQFAKKYNLPIKMVVCTHHPAPTCPVLDSAYLGEGHLVGSGKFDGMRSEEAKGKITETVGGKMVIRYKLRDWVFSRQRYWGEPIPIIHCEKCGTVPVPEKDLPVKLPKVENYKPTDTGESPLAAVTSWVNVKCPMCKGPAKRETDTMPNWAGSSWYYLRYLDPNNKRQFVGKKKLTYWCGLSSQLPTTNYQLPTGPVDWYNGGMEHTTLHLLYSRFWHKFLYDQKLVPTPEPYAKRTSHGLILAEGGEKMSKSKGNVVNPDTIVERFGADTLRVYEMFMGPFEQAISWSTASLVGARRFLERVWRLKEKTQSTAHKNQTKHNPQNTKLQTLIHQTIKKVNGDIEAMRFNTAVSALMILVHALEKEERIEKGDFETLLTLLAPFAPHLSEELWAQLGHKKSITRESWPCHDARLAENAAVSIVVQVNGKVRGTFSAARGEPKEALAERALALPEIGKWVAGKRPAKLIVVPDRLVNIVV